MKPTGQLDIIYPSSPFCLLLSWNVWVRVWVSEWVVLVLAKNITRKIFQSRSLKFLIIKILNVMNLLHSLSGTVYLYKPSRTPTRKMPIWIQISILLHYFVNGISYRTLSFLSLTAPHQFACHNVCCTDELTLLSVFTTTCDVCTWYLNLYYIWQISKTGA